MEQEVEILSENITLAGTLTRPDNPKAMVVFAHGSGPVDRNENTQTAPLEVFSTLAQTLCDHRIASLRYDKRGIGGSTGDFFSAGQQLLVSDLRSVAEYASDIMPVPLFLCGHSEGTYLAPDVALKVNLKGLVLICPYLQSGYDILINQVSRYDAKIASLPGFKGWFTRRWLDLVGWPTTQQRRFMHKVMKSDLPILRRAGKNIPVTWLRDIIQSDPALVHAGYIIPTLILTAEFDVQCDPADGPKIAMLGPERISIQLDGLSHILRQTDCADIEDYARQLGEPIDPVVGQKMIEWLEDQL